MPKKPNRLPALLIMKTDVTTITIAAAMVMTVVTTMITVTMTAAPGMTIIQRAQEADKTIVTDLIPPSTPLTPVSSAPKT